MEMKPENPSYYKKGGIECIQAIKAVMDADEYKGYLRGNVFKYLWRYKEKNGAEDLEKAKVYLSWLLDEERKTVTKEVAPKKFELKVKDKAAGEIGLQKAVENYNLVSGSDNDLYEFVDMLQAIKRGEGEVLLYKGLKKDEGDDYYDEPDIWYSVVSAKVVKQSNG
jgi:hypothetical protein